MHYNCQLYKVTSVYIQISEDMNVHVHDMMFYWYISQSPTSYHCSSTRSRGTWPHHLRQTLQSHVKGKLYSILRKYHLEVPIHTQHQNTYIHAGGPETKSTLSASSKDVTSCPHTHG